MAAPGARRFPLPAQEQSATMVPETAPAEKRRQQVSESRSKSGSIIVESNVKEKPLSLGSLQGKIRRKVSFRKENQFLTIALL